MTVTNQQAQLMNKEIEKGGDLKRAAAKAGMCRQTAAKYHHGKRLPMPKPDHPGTSFALRKVELRVHLDGSIDVFAGKQLIASFPKLESLAEVVKIEEYQPDMRFYYGSGQL